MEPTSATCRRCNIRDEGLLHGIKSWEELLREMKMRHKGFIQARREIPAKASSEKGKSTRLQRPSVVRTRILQPVPGRNAK
jgi:hypothetical protein